MKTPLRLCACGAVNLNTMDAYDTETGVQVYTAKRYTDYVGRVHRVTDCDPAITHGPDCWRTHPFCATERIEKVLALHHDTVDVVDTSGGPEDVVHCAECGHIPNEDEPTCSTVTAIRGGWDV